MYEILEGLSELDLIFLEGFKKEPFRKILLYRKEAGQPPAADPAECFLVISDEEKDLLIGEKTVSWEPGSDNVGMFRPDQTEEIATAILEEM